MFQTSHRDGRTLAGRVGCSFPIEVTTFLDANDVRDIVVVHLGAGASFFVRVACQ